MKMKNTFIWATLFVAQIMGSMVYGKVLDVLSPDKNIKVSIELKDKIYYSIFFHDDVLLNNCTLGMTLPKEVLGANPVLENAQEGTVDETRRREIPLKNALVRNHYNYLRMDMAGNYAVEFRVFDDGVAYRFITDRKKKLEVIDEEFNINFSSDYRAYVGEAHAFSTSYESVYTRLQTESYGADDIMTYLPALLEHPDGYKILISEADLVDYPCMFLKSTGNNGMHALFPKCPVRFEDDNDYKLKIVEEAPYIAKTSGERNFPWRFFVIAKHEKTLVENEMVYKLSAPCELEDYSWVTPGKSSWEWWNPSLYNVGFRVGSNTQTYKYYVDFAANMGLEYMLMDGAWMAAASDPWTPNPEINLPEVIQYAMQRNVKVLLWLSWLTVEKHFDQLFARYAMAGISGLKIDFMERSDQWMVNFYERVAKEAAKYKLVVDFHGSFKPAGLECRYPNVLSYEAVVGMEMGKRCDPSNNIWLPFIRNAVGPMDFTPGAMCNVHPEENNFDIWTHKNAGASGTRAYQMALYVVFESGLQMMSDSPTLYYRERPCADFIADIPVVWDETRVLEAKLGEYVVVARRSGNKWFIGGITNGDPRTVTVDLDFLAPNRIFHLTGFSDGMNADRWAMDYVRQETDICSTTVLTLKLARNGGYVGMIE